MAGHSKWSNIKRKKAATDAKRGKVFTRLLKEVQMAAKLGGGSPDANPRLRSAIQAAKSERVPQDNIERAIKRGTGDMEGVDYEEITYEGYGPGGVAILVKTLTDNKNRTAGDVRHAFSRSNGNLGGSNSVAYMFSEKGIVLVEKQRITEEKLLEIALDSGAEDIKDVGESWEITVDPLSYSAVVEVLEKFELSPQGEIQLVPASSVLVSGDDARNLMKLLEALDELDDVQSFTANFEIDDSELEAINSGGA